MKILVYSAVNTVYNISGCVLSDIQARVEDKWLYVCYNTDANILKYVMM